MPENELFRTFDNNKLIDIVKNYRKYKYDERLKLLALEILNERGISDEDLKLTGNYSNNTYTNAAEQYERHGKLSAITFVLYLAWLTSNLLLKTGFFGTFTGLAIAVYILIVALYFFYLVKSFIEYSNFYKVIGKESEASGIILYLVAGMPLYIFMHFYFRKQMKDELQLV